MLIEWTTQAGGHRDKRPRPDTEVLPDGIERRATWAGQRPASPNGLS